MAIFATKKRLILFLSGAFVALVILGSSAESFFFSPIVTEKVEISAGIADGNWENPDNVKGLPQVAADDGEDEFTKNNSALYTKGAKELVLGEFNVTGDDALLKTEDEEILEQLQDGLAGEGQAEDEEEFSAPRNEEENALPELDNADGSGGTESGESVEEDGEEDGESNSIDSDESNSVELDESDSADPAESDEGSISKFLKNLLAFKPARAQEKKDLESLKANTHVLFARVKASMAILPAALEEMETVGVDETEDSVAAKDVSENTAAEDEAEGDGVADGDPEIQRPNETEEFQGTEEIDGSADTAQETLEDSDPSSELLVEDGVETSVANESVIEPKAETEAEPQSQANVIGDETEPATYGSVSEEEVEAAISALGMDIDAKVIVWYSMPATDGADNWQVFETITQDSISNKQNGGYFSWEAPFLETWDDITNLKLKFEGVVDGEVRSTVYLDSVWVEAEYEEGAEDEISAAARKFGKKGWFLKADKSDWGMNQEPVFILENAEAADAGLGEKVIQFFVKPEITVGITAVDGEKIELKKRRRLRDQRECRGRHNRNKAD